MGKLIKMKPRKKGIMDVLDDLEKSVEKLEELQIENSINQFFLRKAENDYIKNCSTIINNKHKHNENKF